MKHPDLTMDNIMPKYRPFVANPNAEFWRAIAYGGQNINYMGESMNSGIYNLILTRRDLNVYVKVGMIPHQNWRVGHVKSYFGIKGRPERLLEFVNLVMADLKTGND